MTGLATITISDQKVGLKFGMPALRQIYEKSARHSFLAADGRFNELGVAHVLFAGYCNYCAMKDEIPSLEFQSFYELVENIDDTEQGKAELRNALTAFEESKTVKNFMEKKKAMEMIRSTGTTSNLSAMGPSDSVL